uniref:Uncharacterized protein n=1 Tax=Caenorhabditis tropicalis TaxID=1561998 RepID=A0A1I7UA23_9PELO
MKSFHFVLLLLFSLVFLAETSILRFNKGLGKGFGEGPSIKKLLEKKDYIMGGRNGMAIRDPVTGPNAKKNQPVEN